MRCGRRSQHRAAAALAVAATDDVVAATDVVAAAGHGLIKQPLFGLWDIFRRRDRIVRDSITRWSKQAPSALLEIRTQQTLHQAVPENQYYYIKSTTNNDPALHGIDGLV